MHYLHWSAFSRGWRHLPWTRQHLFFPKIHTILSNFWLRRSDAGVLTLIRMVQGGEIFSKLGGFSSLK